MKVWMIRSNILAILTTAIMMNPISSLACGVINLKQEKNLVAKSTQYPKGVLEGAAYALFGSGLDFDTPDGKAQFFEKVDELELLRKSKYPGKQPFYFGGPYSLGKIELMLDRDTWDYVWKLPLLDNTYPEHPHVDVTKADPNSSIGKLAKAIGGTKISIYDWYEGNSGLYGGRVYIDFTSIWLDHEKLANRIPEKYAGIHDANVNGYLCTSDPQRVSWINEGVYQYSDYHKLTVARFTVREAKVEQLPYGPVDPNVPSEYISTRGRKFTLVMDAKMGSSWRTDSGALWSRAVGGPYTHNGIVLDNRIVDSQASKSCAAVGRLPSKQDYLNLIEELTPKDLDTLFPNMGNAYWLSEYAGKDEYGSYAWSFTPYDRNHRFPHTFEKEDTNGSYIYSRCVR